MPFGFVAFWDYSPRQREAVPQAWKSQLPFGFVAFWDASPYRSPSATDRCTVSIAFRLCRLLGPSRRAPRASRTARATSLNCLSALSPFGTAAPPPPPSSPPSAPSQLPFGFVAFWDKKMTISDVRLSVQRLNCLSALSPFGTRSLRRQHIYSGTASRLNCLSALSPFGTIYMALTICLTSCSCLNCLSALSPFGTQEDRTVPEGERALRVSIAFRLCRLLGHKSWAIGTLWDLVHKSQLPFGFVAFWDCLGRDSPEHGTVDVSIAFRLCRLLGQQR